MMKSIYLCLPALVLASIAFGQSDRGTITGAVADQSGAFIAGAPIEARNTETGGLYQAGSSATGNYTLAQLPTGSYQIVVSVPGFKTFIRESVTLGVAQVLRIDITLEVGAASESVTVTDAAPLLKTESGELSHNVTSQNLNQLPILGIGSGQASSSGIRNPFAASQLIPGVEFSGTGNRIRVNGAQGNTQSLRIEGQDATNNYLSGFNQHTQPSVDAIQEVSIQTSNFAAEFGQVGGGLFNLTMKSGSNQYHGSAYDYLVNEALNAGQPFTDNGSGGLLRGLARRNDYGFTFGGPVWIPGVYDGHDKTFFFVNFEQFRESRDINNVALTLPTTAYRQGDFTQAWTARNLALDPIGRQIREGTVYDPATQYLAPNGQTIRDPFPGNIVPVSRMDRVALAVQDLVPAAQNPNAIVNNAIFPFLSETVSTIPSVKADHSLSDKAKISFYFSHMSTERAKGTGGHQGDGLPLPITSNKGFFIYSQTERLNFDYTLAPTMLLHLGAGYMDHRSDTVSELNDYDAAAGIGLRGLPVNRTFPKFISMTNARGGLKNLGTNDSALGRAALPTANASLTWVKNNHTFKFGAEMRVQGFVGIVYTNSTGSFGFNGAETGLPSTLGQNLAGGSVGFPYASFLLGRVNQLSLIEPPHYRLGKHQWGFFAQDSWKVTRKFTLDYGLRYDYSSYPKEQYGRLLNFSMGQPNPTAGGKLGGVIFEGSGPGRCDCNFAKNYPLAFAPRLGAAYQITPKTVLRAGLGLVYTNTGDVNGATGALTLTTPIDAPAFGEPVMNLQDGITLARSEYQWPNFDPGQFPRVGAFNSPPVAIDQNAGRPARQWQWSIGLQREIARDLVIEASYVGNRGVWWNSPGLINLNALRPEFLMSQYGLDVTQAADRSLLTSRIDSSTAAARGFNGVPYPGFSTTAPVSQALRPYPQFSNFNTWWSPLGKTWYDSLQVTATKRLSMGLTFTSVFTWQKNLAMGSANSPTSGSAGGNRVNDVFNREQNKYISEYDQPFVSTTSVTYTLPTLNINRIASWAIRDWTLGAVLTYQSGMPILAPAATNALNSHLFQSTYANRVPGQPLFTQDLNCHCFDPNQEFTLNPAAWAQPAGGQFGTSAAYYTDYRQQRRPSENFNIGRTFRMAESVTFNIRAEFTNILNRTYMNNPTSTNALATQNRNSSGQPNGGFGWINTASVAQPAREGTIVARITF